MEQDYITWSHFDVIQNEYSSSSNKQSVSIVKHLNMHVFTSAVPVMATPDSIV
jgi:hypothetical protein